MPSYYTMNYSETHLTCGFFSISAVVGTSTDMVVSTGYAGFIHMLIIYAMLWYLLLYIHLCCIL
jgi:hypothetical protein